VYAIVVTVYDSANNSARARKIFNYNDQPGFTETDVPVYFRESGQKNAFISDLDNKQKLTLTFAGRFEVEQHELGSRVEPWPAEQHSIDDIYGTTFGERSIDAVSGVSGIANMSCSCTVNRAPGGPEFAEPGPDSQETNGVVTGNCTADLQETATLDFDLPLRSGDMVLVTLTVTDYRGTVSTVTAESMVDETRANISGHQFRKNRDDIYESLYVDFALLMLLDIGKCSTFCSSIDYTGWPKKVSHHQFFKKSH